MIAPFLHFRHSKAFPWGKVDRRKARRKGFHPSVTFGDSSPERGAFLLFIEFIDGSHQFIQCLLDIGIFQLCAGCGSIAAAAQRLQDHLHIG